MHKEKPRGLDGWLILPIIGLFLSIIILIYDLLSTNASYGFDFYFGLLSIFDIVIIVWAVIALFSIFGKKKSAPKVMVSFYVANIILQFVLGLLTEDFSSVLGPIVAGAIWIPYFIKSERVKNTFVK